MNGWLKLVTAALLAMLLLEAAAAQDPTLTGKFLTAPYRGRDPLSVVYSLEMPGTSTMAAATVTITDAKGPTPEDRDLVVTLFAKNWGYSQESYAVSQKVRLAEGQTTAQIEIPCVIGNQTQLAWDIGLFEENRDIEDRRGSKTTNQQLGFHYSYSGQQQSAVAAVLLATNANQAKELQFANAFQAAAFPAAVNANNAVYYSPSGAVANAISAQPIRVNEASDDWRRYFPYLGLIASAEAVAEIEQTQPAVAEAIRTYVCAGGLLLVHSADSADKFESVSRLLSAPGGDARPTSWQPIANNRPGWWWIDESELPGYEAADYVVLGQTPLGNNQINVVIDDGTGPRTVTITQDPTKPIQPIEESINEVLGIGIGMEAKVKAKKKSDKNSDKDRDNAAEDVGDITLQGVLFDAAVLGETILRGGTLGRNFENAQELSSLLDLGTDGISAYHSARGNLLARLSSERLLMRSYGLGKVVISERPLAEVNSRLVGQSGRAIQSATGNRASSATDGNWFYRNLISAVGKPPVWTFCFMVALFGALLGPGLLVLTGRMQRRSLMILLVPAVSLLATASIVLYGIFHEGFDTHLRVSSVITYEAPAQEAFAWSRQNYFSGMPPRDGLRFRKHTYARPVYANDEARTYGGELDPRRGVRIYVDLSEDQRYQGWLRPRQQQQMMVGHDVQASSIPISTERSPADELVLTNLTEHTIELVLLRGAGDDYYAVEQFAAGEVKTCQAISHADAAAIAARVGADVRPAVPAEMQEGAGSLLRLGSRSYYYGQQYQGELDDVINVTVTQRLSSKLELPEFGFSALLPVGDAIEIPLEGKRAEELCIAIGVEPW